MVFLVIGLTTFVFAYLQIRRSIFLPFVRRTDVAFKSSDELDAERLALLKSTDTDKDGLSDYDELYVFRTSPFLADSDSDGIPDGVEVANGTDPNCPEGKICRQPSIDAANSPAVGSPAAAGAPPNAALGGSDGTKVSASQAERAAKAIIETFGDPTTLTKEKVAAKIGSMTSAELRAFLVELGISEDALGKADDATLRKLLQDTLIEVAASSRGSADAPAGGPSNSMGGTKAKN